MFESMELVGAPEEDWAGCWLERESGEGSQWELLERIGAWERIVAWVQANQLREMAAFAHGAEQDAVQHAHLDPPTRTHRRTRP